MTHPLVTLLVLCIGNHRRHVMTTDARELEEFKDAFGMVCISQVIGQGLRMRLTHVPPGLGNECQVLRVEFVKKFHDPNDIRRGRVVQSVRACGDPFMQIDAASGVQDSSVNSGW